MFTVAMQIFPPNRLGAAMGVCAMLIILAPAIGPTVTDLILAKLSWNWIFWMFVPFLVVAIIFAFTSLKNTTKITRPKIDYLSIIESAVGFASLVASVSLASDLGLTSVPVIGLFVLAIIVLALYVHRQLMLENPILNLKIFSIPQFRTGALLVMIDFGIILSAMYLLPQFIQNGLSIAVALTGIIMPPGGIINALTSALAGRIYDSQGAKRPTILGFIIAAQTYAPNAIQGPESADGSTITNTLQQIVGAIAPAIATILLATGQSTVAGSSAVKFTNGTHYVFYFTLVLIVIGLLLSLTIKEDQNS